MHAPINECVVASVFIMATLSTNCLLHVHTCTYTILHIHVHLQVCNRGHAQNSSVANGNRTDWQLGH